MLRLTRMSDFDKADYHGFTLQNNFWYGVDTNSRRYIATSGWECNGCVAIYFKNGNSWHMEWIDEDEENFELRNVPEINMNEKMSFQKWLKEEFDMTYEYFENNCNGNQEHEEYNDYLYDGLPKFVRNSVATNDKTKNNNQKSILEYLENCYAGAKMMDDIEVQERIARAIVAFNADLDIDIFSKELIESETSV